MQFRDENIRFADEYGLGAEVFSDTVVTVELRPEAASRQGNVAAFLLALNLLSRTFEHVHAVFPVQAELGRHPWHHQTVAEVVDELRATVGAALHVGPPERSDVVLSIAQRPSILAEREVLVSGSHWLAALDCDLPEAGEGVLGSLYAATMGAAQVLLHALEIAGASYKPMAPFSFSLLDLLESGEDAPAPSRYSIPEAHLVGVGAVGSAAIYALGHLDDVDGTLHLIDNERVGASNLNRYVLMRGRDVEEWKVDVAKEALRNTAIRVESYPGAFASYAAENGALVDLLLSPIDTEEGRRSLARMLPRRVINAATGGTTLTVSTHGFADGKACLHCLYLLEPNEASREDIMAADMGLSVDRVRSLVETNAPVDAELVAQIERARGKVPGTWASYVGLPIDSVYGKAVCGDAEIRTATTNVTAPLSFISAAAGILLAAELIKSGHPDLARWRLDSYFRVNTLSRPNPAFRFRQPQDASGRCICADPVYVDVYAEKYSFE